MPGPEEAGSAPPRRPVHPLVELLGSYSWRLIAIGIVGWVALRLLAQLRVVVFPVVVALLITIVLSAPARWLRARGWPPLAATWVVFLGFLGVIVTAGFLIVPAVADEFAGLGPTVGRAVDQVENWLVEDSPFDLSQRRLDELQEQAGQTIRRTLSGSGGVVLHTAVVVIEVVAGALLALVMTFFFVKDGEKMQRWALGHIPEDRRDLVCRLSSRAWRTLAAYLRGSAMLGVIEGLIIGVTLWLAGGALVIPVMMLTFMAAFVPFVGAAVAALVAVAVALATAGVAPALVVAAVAVGVQQLDNDVLAPFVFGKALSLHPLVIIVSLAAGGALAGIAGAVMAVPLTAVVINVTAEARAAAADGEPGGEGAG